MREAATVAGVAGIARVAGIAGIARVVVAGALGMGLLSAAAAAAGPDPAVMAKLPVGQAYKDPKSAATFTFLQKNAGASSASTWRSARSLGCGYAVGMPGPYNELKVAGPTPDGGSMSTISLATRTVEGCRFTVSCTQTPMAGWRRTPCPVCWRDLRVPARRWRGRRRPSRGTRRRACACEARAAACSGSRSSGWTIASTSMIECPAVEEKGFVAIEGHFFDSLDLHPPGGAK
jgi:hypothetical protein